MSTELDSRDNNLDERAAHLLKTLVERYIGSGRPIGSRTLARVAGLELSPATIRNVMAELEEMGLIHAPHTSAGRIPTVKGYRLFVDTMLKVRPLNLDLAARLKDRLDPDMPHQSLVESASSMLSGITSLVGVVTVPHRNQGSFRHIEFLGLSENRVLAIVVRNQQEVENRILHLEREYTALELQQAANYLNAQFGGRTLEAVRQDLKGELDTVRQDMDRIMRSAIELGEQIFACEQSPPGNDYVIVGQTNLLEFEELSDIQKLRQLFDAFAHKRDILHILDRCMGAQGVQLFIGQESGYRVLDDCSVVSAPYLVSEDAVGVLGVIGPTRMAYDRVIPLVDTTARLLSEALNARN